MCQGTILPCELMTEPRKVYQVIMQNRKIGLTMTDFLTERICAFDLPY